MNMLGVERSVLQVINLFGLSFFLSFLLSSNILLSRTLNGKSGEEERDGLTMFHQVHYVWKKTTTSANTLLFSRGNIVSKSCSAKDIAE